jgi:AraC-like DNA-binding protein
MDEFTHLTWRDFIEETENHAKLLQKTADRMGISPKQLKEAFCAGRVYRGIYGGLVIK